VIGTAWLEGRLPDYLPISSGSDEERKRLQQHSGVWTAPGCAFSYCLLYLNTLQTCRDVLPFLLGCWATKHCNNNGGTYFLNTDFLVISFCGCILDQRPWLTWLLMPDFALNTEAEGSIPLRSDRLGSWFNMIKLDKESVN